VNALDASNGAVVWSRNAGADTGAKGPHVGLCWLALVVGDVVIVAASGALVAYDVATGDPRWFGPKGGAGYTSPHLVIIDGVTQVLQLNGTAGDSVTPADGKVLWEHAWKGYPIVQPALTADGDVLISVADRSGTRPHCNRAWTRWMDAKERWTSIGLSLISNDFVVHKGYAFGFEKKEKTAVFSRASTSRMAGESGRAAVMVMASLFCCLSRTLLLVLSEDGELALVAATPNESKSSRDSRRSGQDLEPTRYWPRPPPGPQQRMSDDRLTAGHSDNKRSGYSAIDAP